MFVGTYTGGSSNLTAIAVGLDASKNTIASANAADYVVGIPTLILMFATPALYKSSKWLKKLWPYEMSESELLGDGNHEELMASKEWSIQEIACLLAIGFGTVWAATSISSMVFGEGFRSAGRILLITTFSIILAQVPAVRKLRGNFDLGLFVAVLFLVTIGFAVDLKQFFGSTFYITLFCFCVIACSILLHLLITRLLKVRFEYVLLSIVGCISDGPTAASSPPAPSGRPLSTSACSWAYWPVPWATMWHRCSLCHPCFHRCLNGKREKRKCVILTYMFQASCTADCGWATAHPDPKLDVAYRRAAGLAGPD